MPADAQITETRYEPPEDLRRGLELFRSHTDIEQRAFDFHTRRTNPSDPERNYRVSHAGTTVQIFETRTPGGLMLIVRAEEELSATIILAFAMEFGVPTELAIVEESDYATEPEVYADWLQRIDNFEGCPGLRMEDCPESWGYEILELSDLEALATEFLTENVTAKPLSEYV